MVHKKGEGTYHHIEKLRRKCLDSSVLGEACLSSQFLNIQEFIRNREFLADARQHAGSLL